MSSLRPDIDVTRRAIVRLVDALTGDPAEQREIIRTAGIEAEAGLTGVWPERSLAPSVVRAPHNDERFHCSFCGKHNGEVRALIAGVPPSFICDECVELCLSIVLERLRKAAA